MQYFADVPTVLLIRLPIVFVSYFEALFPTSYSFHETFAHPRKPATIRRLRELMPKTDIARRVYNHTWKLDPIVRSLLDTDFYKLLMLQMIWGLYPKVDATFSLINRKTSVKLADRVFARMR